MNDPDTAGMLLHGWTCEQLAHAIGDLRAAGDSCAAVTSPHSLFSLIADGTLTDAAIEVMKRWEELTGEERPACDLPPKLQEMLQAQRVFRHVFEELKLGLVPTNNRKDRQTMDNLQPGTAPKVTPADIEAEIASEHYFTAEEGVIGSAWIRDSEPSLAALDAHMPSPLKLLTFCVLILRNGFTVTGESACASPENFDAEVGRKVARAAAVSKCWSLLGYALRSKLAADAEKKVAEPIEIIRTTTMQDPNDFGHIVTYEAKKGDKTASARLRTCNFKSNAAMQNEAFRLLHEEFARQDNDRQQDA